MAVSEDALDPSTFKSGNHCRKSGRYQFLLPNSFMEAGTRTVLTMVVSGGVQQNRRRHAEAELLHLYQISGGKASKHGNHDEGGPCGKY